MQISELKCGESAEIIGFQSGDPSYRQRLLAMGFLPGTPLTLARIAPLGDPIEINLRGYAISLRKEEAAILQIRRISV